MQYIDSAIHFSILAMILITPFVMPFLLRREGSVANLRLSSFLSFIVCLLLVFLFAYWSDLLVTLRLDYLGFDFDGWSDADRAKNITPALRDEATKLYYSRMGVGWPLKAIIGAVLLIPYQILASGLVFMVRKWKKQGQII